MVKKHSKFQKFLEDARALLDERSPALLSGASKMHWFAHFWIVVWKTFVRNRCPVRAAALAYATALALIPMLAVAMSITSSLLKQQGEAQINEFIGKLVASVTPPATVSTNTTGVTNRPAAASPAGAATNAPATTANNPLASAAATSQTNQATATAYSETEEAKQARQAVAKYIHEFIQNTRSGAGSHGQCPARFRSHFPAEPGGGHLQRPLGRDAGAKLVHAHRALLGRHQPGPGAVGGGAGVGNRPAPRQPAGC